jgi:hypothetical protein
MCKETLESRDDRDFKTCHCGLVAIDGGLNGRVIGNKEHWETRNVYKAQVHGKTIWLPLNPS